MENRKPTALLRVVLAAPLLGGLAVTSCVSTEDVGLAPIVARGSIGTRVIQRNNPEGGSELTMQATAGINAQTYIWQPWFATVDGKLDLVTDYTQSDAEDTQGVIATGSLQLNTLPLSQYPATLRYSHTDSQVDGSFASSGYTRDSISLDARAVVTPTIRTTFRTGYDAVAQENGSDQSRFRISLNADKVFGVDEAFLGLNQLSGGLEFSTSTLETADPLEGDFEDTTLLGTIRYRAEPMPGLVTDSSTTALLREESDDLNSLTQFNIQGVSSLQWRPADQPYTVNGLLRTLYEDIQTDGIGEGDAGTRTLAVASLSINWPISTNLSVSGGVRGEYEALDREFTDAVAIAEDAGDRIEGGVFGSAIYTADAFDLGGFNYRWSASSNGEAGFETQDGANYNINVGLGHSVDREVTFPLLGPLRFSATQDGSVTFDDDGGVNPRTTHSLSLSYFGGGQDVSSFARLGLRDTREFGDDKDEFQSLEFIFNRTSVLDRKRQWFGNAALQVSRQVNESDSDIFISANGSIGYREAPFFDVDGLIFTSEVQLNALGLDELVVRRDDLDNDRSDLYSADWRNRLDYRIGLLTAGIEAGTIVRRSGVGTLLLFRVRRDISGFGF